MNDDKKKILNQVVGDKKLQIMEIDMNYSDLGLPLERRVLPSVENWLASFRDADFVVTDSFHCWFFIHDDFTKCSVRKEVFQFFIRL